MMFDVNMRAVAALSALLALCAAPALAEDAAPPAPAQETMAVHGQATLVVQGHDRFTSPFAGHNSLSPKAVGRETFDMTLYLGVRPWKGAELWINPEIDQGFGLSNTLGVAGFPSGEAYKVGKSTPYPKLPRAFLRQTIDLDGEGGGERQAVEADQNQLAGSRAADRLVLTLGKFSVVDVFDTNAYAHDPRRDFLNWAIIDAGVFDYAANAWGYTYGAAAELYEGRWTLRAGAFDLSSEPNSATLDKRFDQFQLVGEVEERHSWRGQPGKLKVTTFLTRGRVGRFDDATRLAASTGAPADIEAVRRYANRSGVSFNLEQQVAPGVGVFVKGGVADGAVEPYEFADIDRTLAAGVSVSGAAWKRPDDTFGLGGVVNAISSAHQRYLNAGGTGILVGDGRLPHPGSERIVEAYYDWALSKGLHVSLDYQFAQNPAYNRDRGPVSIGAVRIHAQF